MVNKDKQIEFYSLARKLLYLFSAFLLFIIVISSTALLFLSKPKRITAPETSTENWTPRNIEEYKGAIGKQIKEGYFLISQSPIAMGPEAKDPKHRFSGNKLNCTNCHLNAGTRIGSAPWVGVTNRFPQFDGRSNSEGSLESRINGCMERSMNGEKLPEDSRQMKAIIAYMTWLSDDVPESRKKEFEGFVKLQIPESAVDRSKGALLYTQRCTVCHGENGQGQRHLDKAGQYLYPPLWGSDSYNDGAGMHRVLTAAQFIKGNMPFGVATAANPVLTDEEAFNVAGYINSFDRPTISNPQLDYPDRKLKPVSTPYGPWADPFPSLQHKYGPFHPIIAYYRDSYKISKTK